MNQQEFNPKVALFEAIHDSLSEIDTPAEDLTAFEFAFDGMYAMDSCAETKTEASAALGALGSEELINGTIIAIAFEVGKFFLFMLVDPILQDNILPNMDQYEEDFIQKTGQPELIKTIRKHVERSIRKHLGKPTP